MPDTNRPDWASHVRPRLASLRLSPTRETEIVDELSQHLEDRYRELVAGGTPSDEATRLALADFQQPPTPIVYWSMLNERYEWRTMAYTDLVDGQPWLAVYSARSTALSGARVARHVGTKLASAAAASSTIAPLT